MNSMSPSPSRRSAPIESRIVRESIREVTWKETRAGTLALMRPVMTSTDGRCVARIRWIPDARAFCAERVICSSTSRPEVIMRSASSSITITMYGSLRCTSFSETGPFSPKPANGSSGSASLSSITPADFSSASRSSTRL